MHQNQSVNVHQFAMVPKAEIPRSSFKIEKAVKTTFDSGFLIPIYLDEILPGDTFSLKTTIFARLATPIFPIMDNMYLETFFFFVPNRILWSNWEKFMGAQDNPGDSISFTIPQVVSPVGGYLVGTLQDQLGIPTAGQIGAGATVSTTALPMRAYNLIWNTWFRDENLQSSLVVNLGDGPDVTTNYNLVRRGKRHDYFTSCLPFAQKGTAVPILSGQAPVKTSAAALVTGAQNPMAFLGAAAGATPGNFTLGITAGNIGISAVAHTGTATQYPSNLYADLNTLTTNTVNQLRQSFQIQKLLERDARGGTRYVELVRSHFGVVLEDYRAQRPVYLGGGSTPININPVAQTGGTGTTGTTTPLGNLAAFGTALANAHGFTSSFTEHGYVMGLASVRADITYQQGLRKLWSRTTRYDFYFPVFAMLGEQAVLNKEIYIDGSANDTIVFGYQARWDEYRYNPSEIRSLFRSTSPGTLDAWHLAQKFTVAPTLSNSFISDTPPVKRVIAVPAQPDFIVDMFFSIKAARPLPMYSVPGMIDHF